MSDYRVSVIICAYTDKRWNELLQAVASLRAQTRLPDEILVVIDHNPVLAGRARAYFGDLRVGDSLRVLENVEQRGLSGARNTGIAQAKGDIFAFMDEDAAAEPDWLERLLEAYQDPSVIGVGGAILPAWQSGRPGWFPEEFDWVVGCTYRGLPVTRQPVRNLIGCNMSYRRSVIEQLGGFRNGIGHVGGRPQGDDETEFCIRLHQTLPGSVLLFQPTAQVSHKVPASRANWRYYRWRCYLEGRSKALLSRLVGRDDGLSSERTYTMRVLPSGVWHGIVSSLRQRNLSGVGRSVAIAAGLLITTYGYGLATVSMMGQKVK